MYEWEQNPWFVIFVNSAKKERRRRRRRRRRRKKMKVGSRVPSELRGLKNDKFWQGHSIKHKDPISYNSRFLSVK